MSFSWSLILHGTESINLAARQRVKAKALSAGYEMVSVTSSSFQAHVHLLRTPRKSSVLSPCSFSTFPSAICLGSASVRFVLPPHVGMSVLLHLLNTPLGAGREIILTNTQLGPLLGGCASHLCSSLGWNLLLSGPHTRVLMVG